MKANAKQTTRTIARQVAELIAEDLFTSGNGLKVHRLVMEIEGTGTMWGVGWCKEAVADQIEEVLLRKHLNHWIETKKKG